MTDAPKITLKQLRCFLAAAETQSFRRAAERLNMTQPSLSAQINNLETELGRRLLERGHSGARLTAIGRELETKARDVLDAAGALVDAAKGEGERTLRLGVTPTVGPYILPRAVVLLRERDPNLRLYIREAPPRILTRQLSEGVHDVIVTHLPVSERDFVSEELFRDPLLFVMPRGHPLSAKTEVDRTDLNGLEVLSLDARYQLHDQVTALCETFGATFQREYEGTSLDALRLMCGLGMGVTFLPHLYVRSEIRDDSEVVARAIAGRAAHRSIGLAWRRSSSRGMAVSSLARALKDAYARLDG